MSGDSNDAQAWSGSGLAVGNLRSAVLDRLTRSLGKDPRTATPRNFYVALSLAAGIGLGGVSTGIQTKWVGGSWK